MTATPTLAQARKAAGLTQAQLSRRAKLDAQYISKVERGLVPGPDARQRIATALDADAARLWPGAAAREAQEAAAKQAREDAAARDERVTTVQPFMAAPNLERIEEVESE
jgi:transcriptional regulator with XRE-family HTH domain